MVSNWVPDDRFIVSIFQNMPMWPVIFKLVSYISTIFVTIDPKMMMINPEIMMIYPKAMTIQPTVMTIDRKILLV